MKKPGALPLWLSVFLMFLSFLAAGILAYHTWTGYQHDIENAERHASNFAVIFSTRLESSLLRAQSDMQTQERRLPFAALTAGALTPRHIEGIHRRMESRLSGFPEMAAYALYDARGALLVSAGKTAIVPQTLADQAIFSALRKTDGADLLFSVDPQTSHLLALTLPLHTPAGGFAAALHGLLDLNFFGHQFNRLQISPYTGVELWRTDPDRRIAHWSRQGGLQTDFAEDAADGGTQAGHIIVSQRLHSFPFRVVVSSGKQRLFTDWVNEDWPIAALSLLLILIAGVALYRLHRTNLREKAIHSQLVTSESRFRELAKILPVGVCHINAEGYLSYANDRFAELAGQPFAAITGLHWKHIVFSADRTKILRTWKKSSRWNECLNFSCEFRLLRPDGHLIDISSEVRAQRSEQGEFIGYLAAHTDITLRKQAENELLIAKQAAENANLSKTHFLAMASHDLRQPIQAMNLFLSALRRTRLGADQISITGYLGQSLQALGDLLYSLLDLSKLDAGMVTPQRTEVAVTDLFQTLDTEFSALALQKGLRFKLCYPNRDLVLFTDSGLMLSVLRNLIDNAFKYTELGGVLVSIRPRGSEALIQIWDTGIGIDPAHGERIFDECFQSNNPQRDRERGLGLGLAISRRIARLLGSDIGYRSRFGWGSVFSLCLPLADKAPVPVHNTLARGLPALESDVAINRPACLAGWRIVVVEDDPMVAESLRISLQGLGFDVTTFNHPGVALMNADVLNANFYISDFNLPGISGLQMLDTLQKRSAQPIHAVLVTGEISREKISEMTLSRWPVLFKPVGLHELLALMDEAAQSVEAHRYAGTYAGADDGS